MTLMTNRPASEESTWTVCPRCRGMQYVKRLKRALYVCPDCDCHLFVPAEERIRQLFDEGTAEVHDPPAHDPDPLAFSDTRAYGERLAEATRATGLNEGVLLAEGLVGGRPMIAAVIDFRFLGGSLGSVMGERITQAAERALERRVPLLIASASGGARMQEGALSLMQMAKTAQALACLDEAGILTISLITDPTYGGVAASFAALCDVIIAEPGARLGFAGRRVIEQTVKETLPSRFQTAEFLLERGIIDMIRRRGDIPGTLSDLLVCADGRAAPASAIAPDNSERFLVREPERLADADPWTCVQRARDVGRPTTLEYLARAFHDFQELHGDRINGDCSAIVGGVATLAGRPVVVVGHQRGRDVRELTERDYGMSDPHGYRKSARLMRLAAKLGLPVVTFIDTPGAAPGVHAEENGQAVAIAENIRLMAGLPVPVVAVIIGEGGSGGALALGVADEILIQEGGVYSVISPEGCASILWKDAGKADTAARALKVDARNLLRLGIVDGVIADPDGGVKKDRHEAARRVAAEVTAALDRLSERSTEKLVIARRAKFRDFSVGETPLPAWSTQRVMA